MTRDTVERLVDSRNEPTEVRSLLEAGVSDDVGDYDFERGLQTHLAAIGTVPGGGAAPSGAGPAGRSATGAGSAKALALAIGLPTATVSAIAAVLLLGTHSLSSSSPSHPAAKTTTAVVEIPSPAEPSVPQSPNAGTADNPAAVAPVEGRRAPAMPTESQRRIAAQPEKLTLAEEAPLPLATDGRSGIVRDFPNDSPKPNRLIRPSSTTPTSATTTSATATPTVVAQDDPRPSEEEIARAERAREEARHAAEDQFQREMDELMQAKRALSGDPKRALDLAEHGQREFKQSLLSEEREHVLLLALIALGRVTEAERRAEPYLTKHPDSPFARRVRAALEASKSRKAR